MPFEKGTSGNPGGRPRAQLEFVDQFRAMVPEAQERLRAMIHSEDEGKAFRAISLVFDRAQGRAPQGQALGDDEQVIPPADEADIERLGQLPAEDRAELRSILERTFKRS